MATSLKTGSGGRSVRKPAEVRDAEKVQFYARPFRLAVHPDAEAWGPIDGPMTLNEQLSINGTRIEVMSPDPL
jgi:hypothetical protein